MAVDGPAEVLQRSCYGTLVSRKYSFFVVEHLQDLSAWFSLPPVHFFVLELASIFSEARFYTDCMKLTSNFNIITRKIDHCDQFVIEHLVWIFEFDFFQFSIICHLKWVFSSPKKSGLH